MAYYENTTVDEIISEHIVVIDDIDGDITDNIVIVSDEYSSNINNAGEYLVVLSATDEFGNIATFNLTIIVKDEVLPEIMGPSVLNLSVSSLSSIEAAINDNFTAVDGHDGQLNIVVIDDNYTLNKNILGSYDVSIEATDASLNTITKDITITVNDVDKPVLESSNIVNVFLSTPITLNAIYNNLVITDNYDDSEDLVIVSITDNYTDNKDVIGNYQVDFSVSDSSGNINNLTIYINVIDNVVPVITGPETLVFSYTEEYVLNDFTNLLTVWDDYDTLTNADLTITENTFTNRTEEVGHFSITYSLMDSSGNIVSHKIELTIIDDQAPVIYIDNYLITVSNNASFKKEDALRMLINNREIPEGDYEITTLVDEYLGNENIPGSYQYSIKLTDDMGQSYQKDFVVKVPELEESNLDSKTLIRNIVVYSLVISVITFVIFKNKKH